MKYRQSQDGLFCGELVKCDRNNNENDYDSLYRPYLIYLLPPWHCSPARAMASSFLMRFLDHTQRRTTIGTNPLDE